MAEVVITIKGNNESKAAFSSVKDSATSAFDKVKSAGKSAFADLKSIVSDFKTHWVGMTAAIGAAWLAASKAWDLAEQAAQFEQSQQAFRSMVQGMGRDAETEFTKIREASAGLIDEKSLVESANKAMSLGIPVEELGNLMEIARAKARDMGITTTQAFDDIATGIGRGSPLILDNLGLAIKLGEAYEEYADSANKTVEQLTNQDKKTALLNATIEAGKEALDRQNLATLTAAEQMQKLTAQVENLKLEAGAFVIKGGLALYGLFQSLAAAALAGSAGIFELISGLGWLSDKVGLTEGVFKEWQLQADAAWEASKGLGKEAVDNMSVLFAKAEDVVAAQKEIASTAETIAKSSTVGSGDSDTDKKALKDMEKGLEDRLEIWEGYYKDLESLHVSAVDDQKTKTQELLDLETKIVEQRQGYTELISSLEEQMWGDNLSASEKYYSEQDKLDAQLSSAMNLSGQAKIDALTAYQQASASAAQQVEEDGKVVIGIQDATWKAMNQVEEAQWAIVEAQDALKAAKQEELAAVGTWIDTLDSAMTKAEEMVKDYTEQLKTLHEKMMGLGMEVDNNQATLAIEAVKGALDAIDDITKKTIYLETITSGGDLAISSEGSSTSVVSDGGLVDPGAPFGSFAVGTRYVSKTGIAQVHQGEDISSRNEVSQQKSKSEKKVYNFGDIIIQEASNVKQMSREFWKEIKRMEATVR